MKFEDLHDVEIGDILECKDLGAMFKVVDIDMMAFRTPILVEMLSGYATTDLTTGLTNSCRFDQSNKQWLYLDVEALRDHVPDYKAMIDVDNLITLEHLEPVTFTEADEAVEDVEIATPTESEEFEAITASQAAELSKRKILRELMDRIRKAISSDFGVFELKVPDLDLDPVTPELEELGYVVRFSMQDDEFTISWEPKL
jgi:hypothetical protein|nr:MAG TPA: hypothetical protein [Caudoviricetes sp.]